MDLIWYLSNINKCIFKAQAVPVWPVDYLWTVTVATVLLTWVWGQSLVQMDIKEQWHLDAYISHLITRRGCAETISRATNPACHYACTYVQILAGLQVC